MKKILVLVTILFAIFLVLGCENSTGGTNPNVNENPTGETNPDVNENPSGETNPDVNENPSDETNPDVNEYPTDETNPDVNENPSGGTNPIGEWWVFENAWYLNSGFVDLYAYYEGNTFIKGGTQTEQIPNNQLLLSSQSKDNAISSWMGSVYKVTDLSKIPYWAY